MSRSRRRKPPRPRWVIDTSSLCRGIRAFFVYQEHLGAPDTPAAAALLEAWHQRSFDWIYSEEILDEYKRVLNRLKLTELPIGQLIAAVRRHGVMVAPAAVESRSPDPTDDPFYAAAEAGSADIVTSNRRHFPSTPHVRIFSPEEALAILGRIKG